MSSTQVRYNKLYIYVYVILAALLVKSPSDPVISPFVSDSTNFYIGVSSSVTYSSYVNIMQYSLTEIGTDGIIKRTLNFSIRFLFLYHYKF